MRTTTISANPSWETAYTLGGHFHNRARHSEETQAHRVTDTAPFQQRNFDQSIGGDILTNEASDEMRHGSIPDLKDFCHALNGTFCDRHTAYDALQFLPIFEPLNKLEATSLNRFLTNPKTNHVLVNNEFMKVVLVHWHPGKYSSIHGHPKGGCLFKVLHGSLEESRYYPDNIQEHVCTNTLQTGDEAYLDDNLAYHSVGNPFDLPAVSLHAYVKGA